MEAYVYENRVALADYLTNDKKEDGGGGGCRRLLAEIDLQIVFAGIRRGAKPGSVEHDALDALDWSEAQRVVEVSSG
eukprot:CAMPEP_0185767550 /NCGR_PEP_ID=MMETSP1174-20130828/44731_1 /TAXON_ID=35687 /ORGANISM="Dictyocha speculum, Strain CCMP1381" /LENGTH=76 /DNA_ID=CAMNT_0028451821 /DNA_START=62 /DNA_END=288 /DNA_ORIENTATION=-